MVQPNTLVSILAAGDDAAAAIGAPGRAFLTYGALRALCKTTMESLRAAGIRRDDRVAIILPNGPEAATAFLAIATAAATAPLNPGFTRDEFMFYLSDIGAAAVVVLDGMESPVRDAAQSLGIIVVELQPLTDGPAGDFVLRGATRSTTATAIDVAPTDLALLLHTSGTTSRPKLVPLSHGNIAASAANIAETLALTPGDVCLNIMPLFHIHGLVAAVTSSIVAGASVICTPGFNAFRFFTWLAEARPTWFTAVPSMHQSLLPLAGRNAGSIAAGRLRFIRSSSASLPPQAMYDLEDAFGVPVIEAYGMTEAAHQMASNPLPPARRHAGSVGRAAGPEIAIMDAHGVLLPGGKTGEVVIRGGNVTAGYLGNPDANATAYTSGWFRTGDQGHFDEAGYLWLTGRLKEIINRGGEKVSPLEVDNIAMQHPAIAQALTFARTHAILGEEVALAVVLKPGSRLDEKELQSFLAQRLAPFKVPQTVVFVAELPKGPTGKPQRLGLAERLGV